MDRYFNSFPSFTIFVSRVSFAFNLMGSIALLVIGVSMKLSRHLIQPSDVNIFIVVMGDVGVLFIVLASFNTFLNTTHVVIIHKEVIGCIYVDMLLLIGSVILKIASLNSREKIVPMFVRESSLIKDFSSEDIKFDLNNTILLPRDNFARSWALVQMDMMCCGLSGPNDYKLLETYQRQGLRPLTPASKTPLSCCVFGRMNLDVDMDRSLLEDCRLNKLKVHQKGCFEIIWKSMRLIDGFARFLIILLIVTEAIQMDLLWRTLRWREYELRS